MPTIYLTESAGQASAEANEALKIVRANEAVLPASYSSRLSMLQNDPDFVALPSGADAMLDPSRITTHLLIKKEENPSAAMKAIIVVWVLVAASFGSSGEVKQSPDISALVGDWSGTSLCQVKPSPCHDENVVFHLSHPQGDKINVEADKIVDGKRVNMGGGEWTYVKPDHTLAWDMPRGTWTLTVDGDVMEGTLITRDKAVFRKLHLRRLK